MLMCLVVFRNGAGGLLQIRVQSGVQTFHHLTFIHPTVNHGHLITTRLITQTLNHAEKKKVIMTLLIYMIGLGLRTY